VAFADGFTNSGLAAFVSGCNGWKNTQKEGQQSRYLDNTFCGLAALMKVTWCRKEH